MYFFDGEKGTLRDSWKRWRLCLYPSCVGVVRLGGASNRSLGNIIRKSKEDYRALKNNDVGGLWTLAWKNLSKLPQFFKHRSEC